MQRLPKRITKSQLFKLGELVYQGEIIILGLELKDRWAAIKVIINHVLIRFVQMNLRNLTSFIFTILFYKGLFYFW
jgi:hypothetical protein